MGPLTIDRLLRGSRGNDTRRGPSATNAGTSLKSPIRTFSDWNENTPGILVADLASRCVGSTEGFYLTTLSTVDLVTGWCQPLTTTAICSFIPQMLMVSSPGSIVAIWSLLIKLIGAIPDY